MINIALPFEFTGVEYKVLKFGNSGFRNRCTVGYFEKHFFLLCEIPDWIIQFYKMICHHRLITDGASDHEKLFLHKFSSVLWMSQCIVGFKVAKSDFSPLSKKSFSFLKLILFVDWNFFYH